MSSKMYDATLLDNATNTNNIPLVYLSCETISEKLLNLNIKNSSVICSSNIGNDIVNNIILKLQKQINLYRVL
jgi:hypothetical protein